MSSDRHKVIPRVMCFIFSKNIEQVVLMKASDEKDFVGKYDPPGGHIEKGESILDAANREIFEETGIKPIVTKLRGIIHVSNFFEKEIMLFITESFSDMVELYEHREGVPEWISLNELDQVEVLEDIKPILKELLELKEAEMLIGTSEFDGKDNVNSIKISVN